MELVALPVFVVWVPIIVTVIIVWIINELVFK